MAGKLIHEYYSKALNDTITDRFIENVLYKKHGIVGTDLVRGVYESISRVTNDYGCLYLKGGIDIKSRMNEIPIGDLDFGCFCTETTYRNIPKNSESIRRRLVEELKNDTYIDMIRDNINDIIDLNKFYNVINSYEDRSVCVSLKEITNIELKASYSNINIVTGESRERLHLFRVYYQISFASGVKVKLLMYDIGMNKHPYELDCSWIVPRLSLDDLCLDQCSCLVKSITSVSTKLEKRIRRVKFLLNSTGREDKFMRDMIEEIALDYRQVELLLKPQINELKIEMKNRTFEEFIEEEIEPLARSVMEQFTSVHRA